MKRMTLNRIKEWQGMGTKALLLAELAFLGSLVGSLIPWGFLMWVTLAGVFLGGATVVTTDLLQRKWLTAFHRGWLCGALVVTFVLFFVGLPGGALSLTAAFALWGAYLMLPLPVYSALWLWRRGIRNTRRG